MAIIFILLAIYNKQSSWLYIALFSFGFICFSLAIDGNFLGWWDYLYVKGSAENTPLVVYFWTIYCLGFLTFVLLLRNKPTLIRPTLLVQGSLARLRKVGYFLCFLSLIAAFINTTRAGEISMLLGSPRDWERMFGSNVFLNYLYFLHLPALVMFALILGRGYGKKYDWFAVVCLVLVTVLHGIKFTILHGFLFFIFAYYISNQEKISKVFYIGGVVLFILLLLSFLFIRGGGMEGFLGYISSSSVNSIYVINKLPLIDVGNIGSFSPFSLSSFEKAYYRFQGEFPPNPSHQKTFMLNDKFNLQNAITLVGFGFGFGFIVVSAFLALGINYLRQSVLTKGYEIFMLVILMDTAFFMFTAWEFFKTKLWFGFFVLLFMDTLARRKVIGKK